MPAGKDKFFGSHIILYKSLHKNLINCYRYFGPISAGYLVNIAFTTHNYEVAVSLFNCNTVAFA